MTNSNFEDLQEFIDERKDAIHNRAANKENKLQQDLKFLNHVLWLNFPELTVLVDYLTKMIKKDKSLLTTVHAKYGICNLSDSILSEMEEPRLLGMETSYSMETLKELAENSSYKLDHLKSLLALPETAQLPENVTLWFNISDNGQLRIWMTISVQPESE